MGGSWDEFVGSIILWDDISKLQVISSHTVFGSERRKDRYFWYSMAHVFKKTYTLFDL